MPPIQSNSSQFKENNFYFSSLFMNIQQAIKKKSQSIWNQSSSLLSITQQAKSGSKYIPINLQSFKTSFAYSYPVCLNHLSPEIIFSREGREGVDIISGYG